MGKEKVSAVILNYNSAEDTKKCVEFLKKQDYENLEIVVVDNTSPNTSDLQILIDFCERDKSIKFISSEKNSGFSAGNNVGIRYALRGNTNWVMVINPDVELRDSKYISKVMKEKEKWNKVGLIGTKVLLPDKFNQNPLRELSSWEEIFYPITYIKQKKYGRNYYKTAEKTGFCQKIIGCCFFISSDFLTKNNLLDENVFLYCEEPIIAKSALRLGFNILYINEMIAYHQHFEKCKPGSVKKRMLMALNSRKYYIKKYSGYNFAEVIMALIVKNIQIFIWKSFK